MLAGGVPGGVNQLVSSQLNYLALTSLIHTLDKASLRGGLVWECIFGHSGQGQGNGY